MANYDSYEGLHAAYNMQNFEPNKNLQNITPLPPSNPYNGAQGSASPYERTAAITAIEDHHKEAEEAEAEATRQAAMGEVRLALRELSTQSKPEVTVDVLEPANVSLRALRKIVDGRKTSKLIPGGKVREKFGERRPFTLSEYMEGVNEESISQKKYTVAETVGGWVVPRVVLTKEAGPLAKPQVDKNVPNWKEFTRLVITADGRAWEKGHIAPTTGREITVGVKPSEDHGEYALNGYSTAKLKRLGQALRFMAENPLHPVDQPGSPESDEPQSDPDTYGRHAAPRE